MGTNFIPFGQTREASTDLAGEEVGKHKLAGLSATSTRSYAQIKATFDPSTKMKSQNNRFALSELVAGQLSIEEEEQRRFEKKVAVGVAAEVKLIKDSIYTQSKAEGFEAGRKEAYEQEKVKLARAIEGLVSLTSTMEKAKLGLSEQYENELLEVAFRLAKLVTNLEIKDRPAGVAATVAEILGRISKEDDVVLKIGHHEYEALDQIRTELANLARTGRIHIELNETLKPGDCIVESVSGEIASFIDLKFEKLHDSLFSNHTLKTGTTL